MKIVKENSTPTNDSALPNSFPSTILVDTTSYCNLKCSMCPHVNMKRKKGNMNWSLFTKIIDEVASVNRQPRVWLVFFGEPLILKKTKPSIFDMIKYCKTRGLADVALNSNGNLLDRQSSERLLDAGLDELYVGIDAFSERTYSQLRVGGNYLKTVQNVLDFNAVLKKRRLKHFRLQVQFVEMQVNQSEKKDFIDFWTTEGISVKIRQKLTWAGLVSSDSDVKACERHECYWAMNTISITDQGDVVTCAADPDGRFIAGNVRERSITEVWNTTLHDLRMFHQDHRWDKLPHPCDTCLDWQVSYQDVVIPAKKRISAALAGKLFR